MNDDDLKENYQKKHEELNGMSRDELMKKLNNEILEQKRRGVFDKEKLEKSIEMIRGYLPEQTYLNIRKIVDELR